MKSAVFAACLLVWGATDSAVGASAGHHHHGNHDHQHGPDCGHVQVVHNGHVDYLHDGHLHHVRPDGTVEEHAIEVSQVNPAGHTGRPAAAPAPNAPKIRHGDHYDYVVNGRLSHKHGDHYDDHGPVQLQTSGQNQGQPSGVAHGTMHGHAHGQMQQHAHAQGGYHHGHAQGGYQYAPAADWCVPVPYCW